MLSVSRVLLTLLTIASLLGISYKIPVPREDILTKTIQLLFSQEQHSGIGVGVFNVNSSFSRDLHSEVFAHHSATVNFIFYNPFNHLRDFDSVGTKELDFILIFLSHDHLSPDPFFVFRHLDEFILRKSSTKLLLVFEEASNLTDHILVLKELYLYKIYHAVTVDMRSVFYTYLPFSTGWNISQIESPESFNDLFPDKCRNLNLNKLIALNSPQFPYDVLPSTNNISSPNYHLYKIVEAKLNTTIDIITRDESEAYGYYVANRDIDLCLNIEPASNFLRGNFHWIYPFQMDSGHYVIVSQKPSIASMITAMWNETSWLFLCVLLITSIIYRFTIPPAQRKITRQILDLVRIVSLGSQEKIFQRNSSRILIVNLSMFCLIYVSILQSTLTAQMISPTIPKQAETMDELWSRGYYFAHKASEPLFSPYSERGILMPSTWKLFDLSFHRQHPQLAMALRKSNLPALKARNGSFYHMVSESTYEAPFGRLMKPRSPYLDFFNDLQFRVIESGIAQYFNTISINFNTFLNTDDTITEIRVSLKQTIIAFYMLVFGFFLAFMVFLIEIVSKWFCFVKYKRSVISIMKKEHRLLSVPSL